MQINDRIPSGNAHSHTSKAQEIKADIIVSAYNTSGNVQMALQVSPHLTLTRNLQVSPLVVISLISQMRKPTGGPSCICRANSLAPLQGVYLPTVTFPASHRETATQGTCLPKYGTPQPTLGNDRHTHGSSHRALRTCTESEHPVFLLVPAPTCKWQQL